MAISNINLDINSSIIPINIELDIIERKIELELGNKKFNLELDLAIASGDMKKSIYDVNNNGIVDNAEKVSGFTVGENIASGTTQRITDVENNKVDKVEGKGLSTNDYTNDEKIKLSGIAENAEVNVNADWNATDGDAEILNKPSTFPPDAHTHSSIVNTAENNAKIEALDIGVKVSRNIADTNPALSVDNVSGTGNIQEFKQGGNLVGFIDKNGTIGGGTEQTVTNKNKYYPLLKDILENEIAKVFTAYWNGSAYVTDSSIGFGRLALQSNTGSSSNGFGYASLRYNTGAYSNGFGPSALSNNTGAYSNGFGPSALSYNTGTYANGVGYNALYNNTGSYSNGFGYAALQNNTGTYANGVGYAALRSNTGANSNGFGHASLQNNTVANSNGFGYDALRSNTGANSNGFGHASLQNNTGANSSGFGYNVLYNNTGANSNGFGYASLYNNTGANSNGFGYYALQNNTGANNTALGYNSFNAFIPNPAGAKSCDYTAIDTTLKRATINAHGFGANGTYTLVDYSTTGTAIGGMAVGTVQIKIIDANTIEFTNGSALRNITSQGTGTHTFTPSMNYSNTTSLGANTQPNRSNQVVLGSTDVNSFRFGGTFRTPASSSDTGVVGEFCYDSNYLYLCTAVNTWKRVALGGETW